ncbi:unnamed protein product [Paramecium pentaurelia]|uniref:Uncharacterized protein n=1 Tax=Paramecium pentaurelia TaxID=43138 RepID=A0A8S1X1L1_9CILI|nr:unnamed protein product [Paramecium pentaurelia]CAD8194465.1 unnamed protein product [Paramecium pentaurelia]
MSTEDAVFQSQTLDKRIDLEFEQDEKVIIIEINPQKVLKEFFAQFQLLNRIIVRYLNYSLQTCLEIQYGRNQLLISSQDSRVLLEDQKIVMQKNKLDQIVDTQGIWIYLNKKTLNLNIGYGEARKETIVAHYIMESVQNSIKSIKQITIWQESIPLNFLPQIISSQKGELKPIRIHTKDHFIPTLSSVILQKCQNIFDLNQGKQAKNLASEIDDLYQQASQIELHQIEYFESGQQVQGVAKFNLGDLIHHSVTIEGCKLNQILKNKQETTQKNGLDPLMTYIRLGLGHFNKDSAGHQFVLEIWPFKHYSSIHDHAGQYGIVKVLQGIINVKIYAILSNAKHLMNPIKSLTCNQNDMTWLSPKLNQVHQLNNFYPQTAITLQCYKYSKKSQEKIKQFAYVANQQYKNFNPLSDFPDIELHTIFKELVEEYSNLYKKK